MNEPTMTVKEDYALTKKWGTAARGAASGFQMIPDRLFKHQKDLKIDNTRMVVLLNVLMHWWEADNLPHPGANIIAKRMGVDKRTVERSLKKLEDDGIIVRLAREQDKRGQSVRRIDPSKLVRRLEKYAM